MMTVECCLIREWVWNNDTTEATKTICWTKDEGAVDPSTVIKCFQKFRKDFKNLNDQTRSSRSKNCGFRGLTPSPWGKYGKKYLESIKRIRHLIVQWGSSPSRPQQIHYVAFRDYQASSTSHSPVCFVPLTTSENPVSSIQRLSGELGISQSKLGSLSRPQQKQPNCTSHTIKI